MKKTDLAYVAGIIDGEGSISILRCDNESNKQYKSFKLRVIVTNTNEWLIQWLVFAFGGSIGCRPGKASHQPYFSWTLYGSQGAKFLQLILPYLKLKRPQAEIAITFQQNKSLRGRRRRTEEQKAIEEAQHIVLAKIHGHGAARRSMSLKSYWASKSPPEAHPNDPRTEELH